ncbi:hypothetical protein HG530_001816 [Fusarium avenaceum]|nr:hypothetical protein HG530_001816 [Fusarium avenaceum]
MVRARISAPTPKAGLNIKRLDRSQVDDLDLDAVLLLEVLGGNKRLANSAAQGDDGQVLARSLNLGLSEGNNEIILLGSFGHREALAVHQLVLENTDGVGVTDSGLQETLGILSAPGGDNLETGNAAVPGREILGVLSTDTSSETVGTTEGDVTRLDTTRHVEGLGGGVDDLIDGLHGEVEGHELTLNGVKTTQGSTNSETTETRLGDRSVNDTLLTEAVEETLGNLVGTVVLGNLLTEDEDLLVLGELLCESLVERISDSVLLDAGGLAIGVRSGLGGAENNRSRKSCASDGRLSERRGSGSAESPS